MHGLKITGHKGFQITFANGWTASVQFGPYNYAADYHSFSHADIDAPKKSDCWESPDAEVAAFPTIYKSTDRMEQCKEWHKFENGDTVDGYQSPEQVLAFLNMVAAKERP